MLEAKIHKEITDYESQIFFGLSGRKIVSVIIGIVLAFGTFFLLKDKLPDDILGDIILAVIVLPIAVGFFKYKGMKFEQFVKILGSYLIKTQRKKCVNIVTTDYYKENKNVKVKSKFGKEYTEFYHFINRRQTNKQRKKVHESLKKYKKEFLKGEKVKKKQNKKLQNAD